MSQGSRVCKTLSWSDVLRPLHPSQRLLATGSRARSLTFPVWPEVPNSRGCGCGRRTGCSLRAGSQVGKDECSGTPGNGSLILLCRPPMVEAPGFGDWPPGGPGWCKDNVLLFSCPGASLFTSSSSTGGRLARASLTGGSHHAKDLKHRLACSRVLSPPFFFFSSFPILFLNIFIDLEREEERGRQKHRCKSETSTG